MWDTFFTLLDYILILIYFQYSHNVAKIGGYQNYGSLYIKLDISENTETFTCRNRIRSNHLISLMSLVHTSFHTNIGITKSQNTDKSYSITKVLILYKTLFFFVRLVLISSFVVHLIIIVPLWVCFAFSVNKFIVVSFFLT